MDQYAQAFNCKPSEVADEFARCPSGLLETMMLYRGFAAAKRRYEESKDTTTLTRGDRMMQLVEEIVFDRAGARLKEARAKKQGHGG